MTSRATCLPGSHYVLEGWEEIERGVCPRCGMTVVWDEVTDSWVEQPGLIVLILTAEEVSALIPDPYKEPSDLDLMIGAQIAAHLDG